MTSTSLQTLGSPILSTTSILSYDMLSSRMSNSFHATSEDSDDEIVWSVSDGFISSSEAGDNTSASAIASDDDFVILSRPRSPGKPLTGLSTPGEDLNDGIQRIQTPATALADAESLAAQLKTLDIASGNKARKEHGKSKKAKKAIQAQTDARREKKGEVPREGTPTKKQRKLADKAAAQTAANAYPSPAPSPFIAKSIPVTSESADFPLPMIKFGERPIVDDLSDIQSVVSFEDESIGGPTLHEEAAAFISSFLSNPDAKFDTVCRLTLLQSLIIELGLATTSLPESLNAAKAFLKSRAFLNIREYIAVREQGPEAVQRAMYPSRSALIKDIKKKRNPTPLKWVKQHGLQVLLVGWMH